MQKMSGTWWRALGFALLFVIGYKIIDNFSRILGYINTILSILTPFIIGGIIAFFLHKPAEKLDELFKRVRLPIVQKFSMLLSLVIVYAAFLFAVYFLLSYLIEAIYKNIADIIANWDIISARFFDIFNAVNLPQKQEWLDKANLFLTNLLETEVLFKAGNIVGGIASSLVSVFTGIIISIYAILEKESLKNIAKKALSLVARPARVDSVSRYSRRLIDMFYSYFTGLAIDAVVVSIISVLFYVIFKAPYPWLLGLIVGVGNMIPFFGPIIAAIIVTFISAMALGPIKALWILLFQIVLGQIDGNVIQPRIIGGSVGISPFWVIFAVLLFGGIWGPWGMLLGVPIVASIRMMILSTNPNVEK